jgi:uncharacterized protein (TIGR00730 family)
MTRAVCVFCASATEIDPRYLTLAADVGQGLGSRGWQLVSGGGSISSMGALAVAARTAGAHTIGVIPRALLAYEVADTDADELVVTEDMRDRKATMDARSDAFLVLPGGIGTMEEFFEAWVGRVLGMHHKPVVVLDPWGDFAALHDLIDGMVAGRFVRPEVAAIVTWVQTVPQALGAIAEQWASPPPRQPAGLPEALVELEAD